MADAGAVSRESHPASTTSDADANDPHASRHVEQPGFPDDPTGPAEGGD